MFCLEYIYRTLLRGGVDREDAPWARILSKTYATRREAQSDANLFSLDDSGYEYRVVELEEEPS